MAKKGTYTFCQIKGSEIYHIFKDDVADRASACNRIDLSTEPEYITYSVFLGRTEIDRFNEKKVRKEAAIIGRNVCGNCIRSFYSLEET